MDPAMSSLSVSGKSSCYNSFSWGLCSHPLELRVEGLSPHGCLFISLPQARLIHKGSGEPQTRIMLCPDERRSVCVALSGHFVAQAVDLHGLFGQITHENIPNLLRARCLLCPWPPFAQVVMSCQFLLSLELF